MIHLQAKSTILCLLLTLSFSSIVSQAIAKEEAPHFTLTDIDGNAFTLSECSAKVVLIDFFTTWCSPCKAAIPALREFYDEYPRDQLEIVSISPENRDTLLNFAKSPQINMTWIVVSDPSGSVLDSYLGGDTRIPHMFLIDSDGYIAYDHLGWSGDEDASELRPKINSIISGDYNSNANQPEWPLTTIAVIVVIIIGLFVVSIIAAGYILGWSSPSKKRSKKHTKTRAEHTTESTNFLSHHKE